MAQTMSTVKRLDTLCISPVVIRLVTDWRKQENGSHWRGRLHAGRAKAAHSTYCVSNYEAVTGNNGLGQQT